MVTTAPLSSPAFLGSAIQGLNRASTDLATSTARLASGSRIINPGDDVASFSIATRLKSQLSGLRQAQQNTAQGTSFVQVASGGLQNIRDVLDRMSAIATQANSGSITATDRTVLQAEFAELIEEVDRLADNTKFNNIVLLDGTVSGENRAQSQTAISTKATGMLTFGVNVGAGQTIVLFNQTLTEGVDFAAAGTIQGTIDNLVIALNNSADPALSYATYSRSGNSLVINMDTGGTIGGIYTIDQGTSTAAFIGSGDTTNVANLFTLTGGVDNGLGFNSVKASGTIGDTIVTAQSQTQASSTLTITGVVNAGELLSIDDGAGALVDFTFVAGAPATNREIQIGATTEDTLRNAVSVISQYTGTDDHIVRQIELQRGTNTLTIRSKNPGGTTDYYFTGTNLAETLVNGTLTSANLNNGTLSGITVNTANNASFIGAIQGFSATFVAPDSITASITIGSSTYTASIADTTPAADTAIRFSSTTGGFFDVTLDGGLGMAVANQTDANTYAGRLNAAMGGLTFYQDRIMSNYSGTGSLVGSSAKIQLSNFTDIKIESIDVTAPVAPGSDGIIDITVNGEVFRSASGIGGKLGAYETFKFTSLSNANKVITLTNGATVNDFSTSTLAATFEGTLRTAFGLDSEGTGLDFQVGTTPTDKINVNIGSAKTAKIFNGVTPDVSSQANAATALTTLDTAKNIIAEIAAEVGAFEERFIEAGENIESSLTGIDAARANLEDTDIVFESTVYAQATLRVNAAVAVIAQTQSLQSTLIGILERS